MYTPPTSIGKIPTRVFYLEMRQLPAGFSRIPSPDPELKLQRRKDLMPDFYRKLYDGIGRDYAWSSRKLLTDEELTAIIADSQVEIFVVYLDHEPMGYVELDLRTTGEVELVYFGLFSAYRRKGIGPYLLNWSIDYVFQEKKPERFWLHTCTLDDPKAIPMYERAGFVPYQEQDEFVDRLSASDGVC